MDDRTPTESLYRIRKSSLDKDLRKLERLEASARSTSLGLLAPGIAFIFLVLTALFAALQAGAQTTSVVMVSAAVLAGYMALNIGANDVANNVGPAVGARALTMAGALVIAAIFESAGALLAGGDVVATISKGIVSPSAVSDSTLFIMIMMSALLSAAIWVNIATYIGAPVSTTHAVVGGVLGTGITAMGVSAINWPVVGAIAMSWVVSPIIGGAIAALFLAFVKTFIIYREDKLSAARLWVPALVSVMAAAFSAYLMMVGLKKVYPAKPEFIAATSFAVLIVSFLFLRPIIRWQSRGLENRNQSLRKLFRLPLIFSAALLSFAHGANDVANAVGPLAGILHSLETGNVSGEVRFPFWIMVVGAIGISMGLFLFGPRLIKTVGEQITRMNPIRAFCVALSAAVTVIVASALGLPVSSTHIAVGAVFGVGFYREHFIAHSKIRRRYLQKKDRDPGSDIRNRASEQDVIRRKLVRRSHFTVIVAAWVITVPATALLASAVFLALKTLS